MFCPKCKAEYREGFYKCTDCGVDLVYELPKEENTSQDDSAIRQNGNIAKLKTIATYLNEADANIALGMLEANGIKADIIADDCGGTRPAISFLTGGYRLVVDEIDAERAIELLKSIKN